jgi:hypothetical protein
VKPVIKDPWRTGQAPPSTRKKPVRKPNAISNKGDAEEEVEANVVGTATSDHPLDQDLKPVRRFLLRAPRQDYALLVNEASDPTEAVHILLRAVHNPAVEGALKSAGFCLADHLQAKPSGFMLTDDEDVLWLPQAVDVADGFRRLVQALLRACREERGFRDRLQQLGLTPIMP